MRERDPISLGPIRTRYRLGRGGASLLYDATSLLSYIVSSGDIRDPISRQPLATYELRRLCRACGRPPLDVDVLKARYRDEMARREMLVYLENEMLAEAHSEHFSVPMLLEVLSNLLAVVKDDERVAALAHFARNGVCVELDATSSAPRLIHVLPRNDNSPRTIAFEDVPVMPVSLAFQLFRSRSTPRLAPGPPPGMRRRAVALSMLPRVRDLAIE